MHSEKNIGFFVLLICLFIMVFYYQYPDMLHLLPQGSHLWRQTDCMAMVWNYKLFDLAFFQPAVFNLQSIHGHVAGEFPVFYYIAARFENPEFVLRSMHTVIFIGGIVSVYFVAYHFLQNAFLSVFSALLLFTSPLLSFYGNNFLSDVPAWGFAMMGWSIFFNTQMKDKIIWTLLAFLFFSMAALLKASQAINFFIAFLFQLSTINYQPSIKRLTPYSLLLSPVAWYVYAKCYNAENRDAYYFLSTFPVWKMSLYDVGLSAWRMAVSWSDNYFWRPTSVLLAAGLFRGLIKNKIINSELKKILGLSFLFTIIYILLFFERMKLHEYYYVVFFVFGVFAVISVVQELLPYSDKIWIRLLLLIFLSGNIYICKNTIHHKLQNQNYNGILASNGFQKFLIEKECTQDKIVVSLPDVSINQSLYWMKRKGFTKFNDYQSALSKKKADFLIVSYADYPGNSSLQPYQIDSIGDFHGVRLFKLR